MLRFDGRVALITGSGRGLGAAYARYLAQRGAQVMVHDAGVAADGGGRDSRLADAVAQTICQDGGQARACYDYLDGPDACQRVIETTQRHFGRLDILIHNAGILSFTPIEEMPRDLFDRMCQVHISAPYWLAQAAWPHMMDQRYGRIVFTTSGRALCAERAQAGLSAYAMGKSAALGLMYTLALEGEPWGIRVNAIAPVAATRMLQRTVDADRFRPEDVAPGVAYLVSEPCDQSGIVLSARDGRFATGTWSFGAAFNADELASRVN